MLNHLAPLETQNSFTVFMQTFESQVRVIGKTLTLLKQEDKKKNLWPLFMDGFQLPQG